jgi:hypothetical protein
MISVPLFQSLTNIALHGSFSDSNYEITFSEEEPDRRLNEFSGLSGRFLP